VFVAPVASHRVAVAASRRNSGCADPPVAAFARQKRRSKSNDGIPPRQAARRTRQRPVRPIEQTYELLFSSADSVRAGIGTFTAESPVWEVRSLEPDSQQRIDHRRRKG